MVFNAGDTDPECTEGVGDINSITEEAETGDCRSISDYVSRYSYYSDSNSYSFNYHFTEAPCIFPFYWEGKLNEGCTMLEHDGFLIRVFYCPIHHTVNKINGIDSYTFSDIVQQVSQDFMNY